MLTVFVNSPALLFNRVSRNTAPCWNIVKTFGRWCFGLNWISRKRCISEGANWRRGETSSYPLCASTCCAVRVVRCFVTSLYNPIFVSLWFSPNWIWLITAAATTEHSGQQLTATKTDYDKLPQLRLRQLITDHVLQYQTKLRTRQNIYYLLTFYWSAIVACGNASYLHLLPSRNLTVSVMMPNYRN